MIIIDKTIKDCILSRKAYSSLETGTHVKEGAPLPSRPFPQSVTEGNMTGVLLAIENNERKLPIPFSSLDLQYAWSVMVISLHT
jgi:hypothetical protein